jgi:hypothetical protein
LFDVPSAVPAHDSRGNLVTDRRQEQSRVTSQRTRLLTDDPNDVATKMAVVEKGDVLRPRKPCQHVEAMVGGGVEHVVWRSGVGTDRVDSCDRHRFEIALELVPIRKVVPILTRCEGTVRNTANQKWFAADAQKLSVRTERVAVFYRTNPHYVPSVTT